MTGNSNEDAAASARDLLRHTLATLAYRARKAVMDTPADFSSFRVADGTRTPGQILAHMCDLMDWALSMAQGKTRWQNTAPERWEDDSARFFVALRALEDELGSDRPLRTSVERLFQAPIADALTHTGQISLLRRLAGGPVRGENYARADIVAGRVGADQAAPRLEFD